MNRFLAMPGIEHLQNIHPLIVHFPVALIPSSAAVYFAAWIGGRPSWQWGGLLLLVMGVTGAAAAVATGLYAVPGVMLAPSVKETLLADHKRIMLATLALGGLLAVWALAARPMPMRGRLLFMLAMLLLVGLLAKGADYGVRMVYDYNAGGFACGQPIEFTH
ncbi:MAG TPA: DUF2231 domain-containing protein [Candidatus Binataceae bacterium]|nr:DUF2231 domain-containing protein [Candidatus Binataceae bacterium]